MFTENNHMVYCDYLSSIDTIEVSIYEVELNAHEVIIGVINLNLKSSFSVGLCGAIFRHASHQN